MTKTATNPAAHDDARKIEEGLAIPEDALTNIEYLVALAGELEELIAAQVDIARAHREPWHDVGLALGMTRQGAQQRYGL